MDKLGIIILNWNGKKHLETYLPSVISNSGEHKVVVVDNNSSDDSVSFLKLTYPQIELIHNIENGGFAKGYNDGLEQIKGRFDYYVLLNSDVEVTANWISPILDLMEKDKTVSACQPKVLAYKNKTKFEHAGASGGYLDKNGYPFCRGRIFDDVEEDKGQYNDAIEVFWATGACLFVRASHYNEVGGLDEDFFAHQEEIDLCWRLKNKGYKVMVQPKSVVYHVGGGTLNAGSPFKTHLNFRNNLYTLFKNLPDYYLFTTIPTRLVLDGIAAFTLLSKEKGLQHLLAIAKAHFAFYSAIPKLMAKRKKIKQKNNLIGKVDWSILLQNKIKGIKRFSEL